MKLVGSLQSEGLSMDQIKGIGTGLLEHAKAEGGEGVPDEYVGRILDGENLLKVFRDWRGLNQSELARKSGVHRVSIADIEAGRKTGSVHTLKKLADALNITIDDLV